MFDLRPHPTWRIHTRKDAFHGFLTFKSMFSRISRATPFVKRAFAAAGVAACTISAAACADFDKKGFDGSIKYNSGKDSSPLTLAGVGMRRKNLYIMEVDV